MTGRLDVPQTQLPDEPAVSGAGALGAGDEVGLGPAEVGPGDRRRRKGKGLGLGAWLAIGWLVFVFGTAILAKTEIVTWGDPFESITECARKGPLAKEGSADGFPLGCDSNGREMPARLALGAFTSLLVATGAILIGFLFGGAVGILAGYFGGRTDGILTSILNVLLSVPAILLALSLVAFLQGSADTPESERTFFAKNPEMTLIVAIGIVAIPLVGRIARASALSWAQRDFVLAAKAQGAKHRRIMFRELLPNVAPAMFSIALLGIAIAIVAEGTLAILGVGVRPPEPSWGNIIAGDRGGLNRYPHVVFLPSILIFLTVLSLNFLGDVVRTRFDVREGGI
jgi:peptide/nickel transport system permease protein